MVLPSTRRTLDAGDREGYVVSRARSRRQLTALLVLVASCSGGPIEPDVVLLEFSVARLDLDTFRDATVTLENTGTVAVEAIALVAGSIRDQGGGTVAAAEIRVTPLEIPTLDPKRSAEIHIEVVLAAGAQPGMYDVSLEARAGVEARAVLDVHRVQSVAHSPS